MESSGGELAKKAMWLYPKVLGFNPSERWGHSACYSHGVVYVYGGCCGGLHFEDVLVLNLDKMAWANLVTTGHGPGPRDSHSATLVGRKMFVFGGTNGSKKVNDMHILDLNTKEWARPECNGTPPSPRESHTATLLCEDKLVIFGGSGEGEANYLNDLHILDLKTMTWTFPGVNGDIPVPRDSHSAIAIANKLFVHGGDCGDRYHGNVDVFDMETLTWSRLAIQGSSPGVRAGHAAVKIDTKVYIIGGVGDKHYYNDVWVLDTFTCSWTQLDTCGHQPQGRFSHTAVVMESDIAIYGGCGEDERPLSELLILQLGAEHPNGRYNISLCKILGNHSNQERRRLSRNNMKSRLIGSNVEATRKEARESEFELKQYARFSSDSFQHKRRRNTTWKAVEIESEQEEHSLSLSSQHSSPSHSDQEQPTIKRANGIDVASQGFPLFQQKNQIQSNCQSRQSPITQTDLRNGICTTPGHKHLEAGSNQNMIGAEVQGKVDGAFDSGYLMTATVNGKIFRGVLFTPGPGVSSMELINPQNPSPLSSHVMTPPHLKSAQMGPKFFRPESTYNHPQAQVVRPVSAFRPNPSMIREPKLRSDLQGVVLTLGGPGSGHGAS